MNKNLRVQLMQLARDINMVQDILDFRMVNYTKWSIPTLEEELQNMKQKEINLAKKLNLAERGV